MKKVAPEVRMTEAARKRSAKIRQDKESAENKGPASPRLRTPITQLPRVKNTENRTKELALEENINFLSLIKGHFHNEIRIFGWIMSTLHSSSHRLSREQHCISLTESFKSHLSLCWIRIRFQL